MEKVVTPVSSNDNRGHAQVPQCPHRASGTHRSGDDRRTAPVREPAGGPAVAQDATGTFHVRSHALAREILRGPNTAQAGFGADALSNLPKTMQRPILFQEGPVHHQQRKATARFFTPRTVNERYRELMTMTTDRLVADLVRTRRANLGALAMSLAVDVAAQIIGLTEHRKGGVIGMARRLEAFFGTQPTRDTGSLKAFALMLRNHWSMGTFYWMDVRPSIRKRRQDPGEDVISHLLAQGYRDSNILIECITYAAAGMVTTREFITVAAWHLFETPDLKARYIAADETNRRAILAEILRLEPVVGILYRHTTAPVTVTHEGQSYTFPTGAHLALSIDAANTDLAAVGCCPLQFHSDRVFPDTRIAPEVLSFGDGSHRCPGAFVALQESEILLSRLCAIPGLRLSKAPELHWNPLVAGYELRDCFIEID